MDPKLNRCAESLRHHRFDAIVVADVNEAFARLKAEITSFAPATVAFGDSMTMQETGILDWLRIDGRYELIDGFDGSMSRPERIEIRRRGLLADLFITGINAVTEQGTLHWLDMVGNRIAPIAFGPHKVILVAGRNKIVATPDQADERIRNIAAPRNVARHPGFRTPCAKTGLCADCDSPDRICNTRMEMVRCYPEQRITVILIDQDLGL